MRHRRSLIVGLVGAVTAALMLPLLAASVDPIHVRGAAARSCQWLADQHSPGSTWNELKVSPPATSGSDGTLNVTVSYASSTMIEKWTAVEGGPAVDAVYVKSGSRGSHLYIYSGAYGDTQLTVPSNQAISHILFCYSGLPANNPPVAEDDAVTTDEDTALTNVDVLGNDKDDDLDPLTVVAVDGTGTVGTVSLSGGQVGYDPAGQFEHLNVGDEETDSFGYTISDGKGGTDTATVVVTIEGVNDAPVVQTDAVTLPEDASAPEQGEEDERVLLIATDVDDDELTVECDIPNIPDLLDENGDPVPIGTYEDNGDGTITFTPYPDFNTGDGNVQFECTATDPGGLEHTDTVTLIITPVPDDPTAVDDVAFADGATPVSIAVLDNDYDVDGDPISIVAVGEPTVGSVTWSPGDDEIVFQGPADFTGHATFTYTISDGTGRTDTATVFVFEILECGESLAVPANDLGVTGEYERLTTPGGCEEGKPYFLDVLTTIGTGGEQLPTVLFQPRPQEGEPVHDCSATPQDCNDEFRAEVTFAPRDAENAPNTGILQYDPVAQESPGAAVFRPMKWCVFDPFADGVEDRKSALPVGESWCIVEVSVGLTSGGQTTTTWLTYGIGDPWKRVS